MWCSLKFEPNLFPSVPQLWHMMSYFTYFYFMKTLTDFYRSTYFYWFYGVFLLFMLSFMDSSFHFNISYRVDLVVMKSFSFCLSNKFLTSILNDNLPGYSIPVCNFFPFNTLNIECHCLLACKVSAEKSPVSFMGCSVYRTIFFSLAALIFFS